MKQSRIIGLLSGSALSALLSAQVFAQASTPTPVEEQRVVETIIVTGSRIRKVDYEGIYPSVSVTSESIEERGITNVLDILNTLPSTGIGATPVGGQASQGAGAAFVNLFDLGSNRTLTVVNGRRFIGGNQATIFGNGAPGLQVDLNVLPTAFIDRTEVISVGGAPIYGADAVAGTVNVILKRKYEGLEIDGQYGQYEGGFGENYRIRGTYGKSFLGDKLNLAGSVEYADVKGFDDTFSARRSQSFSFVPNPLNGAPFTTVSEPNGVFDNYLIQNRRLPSLTNGGAIFRTGGSATYLTAADRQYLLDNPNVNPLFALNNAATNALITRPATAAELAAGARARVAVSIKFDPNGNISPFNVGKISATDILNAQNAIGGEGFDFGNVSALQSELKRTLFNSIGSYEATPWLRLSYEYLRAEIDAVELTNQPAFNSSLFGGTSIALGFRTDNPFLTAQARQTLEDPALNLTPATAASLSQTSYTAASSAFGGCLAPNMPADIAAGCAAPGANVRTFFTSRYHQDVIGNAPSLASTVTDRIVLAAEGDFKIGKRQFDYEVAYGRGTSKAANSGFSISQGRFTAARDAIRDTNGQIVCRVNSSNPAEKTAARFWFRYTNVAPPAGQKEFDPSSPAPPAGFFRRGVEDTNRISESELNACKPINTFGFGAPSADAQAYVRQEINAKNDNEQEFFDASISGSLFDLPAGEIKAALGYQWRREFSSYGPTNEETRIGTARSAGLLAVENEYTSSEVFTELQIPVFGQDFKFPLLHSLELNGAFRRLDNSIAGEGDAWTYGLTYQPVPYLTIRGNKTQSVRAPALVELYLPPTTTFATAGDPCDSTLINGGPSPALRRANCTAAAAAAGFTGLSTFSSNVRFATVAGQTAGNTSLKNELAESETIGFILRPDWFGKPALAVDFVRINLTNSIENFSLINLFNSCYDNATPNTAACSRFRRDANFQILLGSPTDPAFNGGFINAGYRDFEGYTATFDWKFDINKIATEYKADLGSLEFRLVWSNIIKLESSILGTGTDLDIQEGEISRPKNEFQLTSKYKLGRFSTVLNWIYQSKAAFDRQFSVENRQQTEVDQYSLFNGSLLYDVTDNIQARLVVNNLFDIEAPFPTGSIAYDQFGRSFSFGLRARF